MIVARHAALEDVGRLALASAAAFLCGSLADAGFTTTLSVPSAYLSAKAPPLRATRRARWTFAACGSALYAVACLAGLGSHDAQFLLLLPLPAALSLAYGYAGAMNFSHRLRDEGIVSAAELVAIPSLALLLETALHGGIAAELLALSTIRVAGTAARALIVSQVPQSNGSVSHLWRRQAEFLPSIVAIVAYGQIDLLILGFMRRFELLGFYGPLLRAAYGTLLAAEALSWALYPASAASVPKRRWRWSGGAFTIVAFAAAVGFALLGQPFLHLVLARDVSRLNTSILIFAAAIVVHFLASYVEIPIIRGGRQTQRLPILLGVVGILVVGSIIGARLGSVRALALSRLSAEIALAAGYLWLSIRPSRTGTLSVARSTDAPSGES